MDTACKDSIYRQREELAGLLRDLIGDDLLGYLGADFDLRDLPVTSEFYKEPDQWRQIKGDPAIRGLLFQQTRVESPMDRDMDQSLAVLKEMLIERGVFQTQIHFSGSQTTIWMNDDQHRYRILDIDTLTDPDICLVYPPQPYPDEALIPAGQIGPILDTLGQENQRRNAAAVRAVTPSSTSPVQSEFHRRSGHSP